MSDFCSGLDHDSDLTFMFEGIGVTPPKMSEHDVNPNLRYLLYHLSCVTLGN